MKKILFFAIALLMVYSIPNAQAANEGGYVTFNVDRQYDVNERSQVQAVLAKTTSHFYFYVEKDWWDAQLPTAKSEMLTNLDFLSLEFSNHIYPTLTSVFGPEWKPGVDGDNKITILFHSMKENTGGYFRLADEYIKLQIPSSNEREMVYLPVSQINSTQLKVFLAHEFTHLIIFNQKDRLQNISEEVWLNEARADYASTILGYDDSYDGSNLQRRVGDFLNSPSDSLTEWQDTKYDYAIVNLFTHYLVDNYGINILTDSLKSKLVGIPSINEILLKNGYKENFGQIFANWTVATLINDCTTSLKYCYLNKNLKNVRVNTTINFLPFSQNSSLSVSNVIKNWSGSWQKIIGGNGDLTLEFSSLSGLDFKVPYITYDKNNQYKIGFLVLDNKQKGQINIKDFGAKYNSLVIIPSLQTKMIGFNGFELTYPYTFTASITTLSPEEDMDEIQKLLDQISVLKKQIAALQGGVEDGNSVSCTQLTANLYVGVLDSVSVSCLQEFLKFQGADIYPQGLVTGYFGTLTKQAVIRFQEKYRAEILTPLGLSGGTGFVGVSTRNKINQLLSL